MTMADIEEKASTVVTQIAQGLPYIEQVVMAFFPQGVIAAVVMKIIGEDLLPGLAKTLHELAQATSGTGKIGIEDVIKGGMQLSQHISSDFPNSPLLDPKANSKAKT
jgi:hypothetical protein